MLAVTVMLLIVSLLPSMTSYIFQYHLHSEQKEVSVFFHVLEQSLAHLQELEVTEQKLTILTPDHKQVSIELAGSNIRQRVNGEGNVYLLRGVAHMTNTKESGMVNIAIVMQSGENYEKTFKIYK